MSTRKRKSAYVNVTLLLLCAAIGLVLVGGVFVARDIRRHVMDRNALEEGLAACEREDWETAREMLGRYLWRHADDPEILAKYAHAELSARPLPNGSIGRAMRAYRKLLGVDPVNETAFERLVLLYETTGNASDLAHIAGKRLEVLPDDPAAVLAQGKALLALRKPDEARTGLEKLVEDLMARTEKRPEFVEACILLSGLAGQARRENSRDRALEWLNRAVDYEPDLPLALVTRAAFRRELARGVDNADRERELEAARADLEKAEGLETPDPRVRLMLSEEWMAHGVFERAAAQLDLVKETDPKTVQKYFVDPDDWFVAQFSQRANLCLQTGAAEEGIKLAEDALGRLKEQRQRLQVLPVTTRLFVAGGRVEQAREALDEYLDKTKLLDTPSIGVERLAFLQAIVARAEKKPYRVVELLEPVVDRPGTPPLVRSMLAVMLAEAYERTGQAGRVAKTLSEVAGTRGLGPGAAKLLARSYLRQGAWTELRDLTRQLEQTQVDDAGAKVLRLAAEVLLLHEQPAPAQSDLDRLTTELTVLREAHPEQVTVRVLLSAIAERRGQTEAAEAELKRAIEQCPNPLGAIIPLTRLYVNDGRFTEAEALLKDACAQHGSRAVPWLALGELLADQQRVDEARAKLREGLQAVAEGDEKRELAVRLASIDVLYGDRAAGIAVLREIATNDPQDVDVRVLLLKLPDVLADESVATELLGDIRRIEGDSGLRWRFHQARAWLASKDWRDRRAAIEELLRYCIDADLRWTRPVLLLGDMYEQLGDLAQAEATYSNGFARSQDTAVGDRLLTLLHRQRRFAEARDLLTRLEKGLDERRLAARRLSLALEEGNYSEAARGLEMRLLGPDKDPMDLVQLARLRYEQHREVDRALADLDEAATIGADPVAVARTRAFILGSEGRADEALAVLDRLVAAERSPAAYMLRASHHLSAGRADLAEKDYVELARVADDAFGHAVLGEFYARDGRLEEAIETWEKGLEDYPDSLTLKRGLAKALLLRDQAGDRERAQAFLAKLEERFAGDTDLLWMRVVDRMNEGTLEALDEARALLKEALGSSPADATTYRGLITLAFQLGEFATASDLARRGLQLNPDATDVLLLRAQAELSLGNLDVAQDLARSAAAANNNDPAAYEVLLEAAARQENLTELERLRARLAVLAPENPDSEVWLLLHARTCLALGHAEAAVELLEDFRASNAGRQSVPVLLFLQDLYRARGDLAAAQQRLDEAAALAPDHPGILPARLLLLGARGEFDKIAALLNESSQAAAQQPGVLQTAATILSMSPEHLDQAVVMCQRAAAIAPDDGSVHLLLGQLSYARGDISGAEQAFRLAVQKNPSLPEALNNLAWLLAQNRAAYDEALIHARKAVALRPTDANFRDTLAFVLHKLGQREEARDEYRRSAELAPAGSPTRAKSLFRLAKVCHELDPSSSIEAYLREALAADSGNSIFTPEERAEINRLLEGTQPVE